MKALIDGHEIEVGDHVCFKCDIEQSAEVIKIGQTRYSGRQLTFKAPADGFAGQYINGQEFHQELASDCWV